MALIHKSEIRISLGSSCSLGDAKSMVVYLTAIHQDYFGRVRMADKDLEEENKRLKTTIRRMLDSRHDSMMKQMKNRGKVTLDLSTDLPLPKFLGGDAEVPIKEHRVNIEEIAHEWAKETAKANQQTLDTNAALTTAINSAGSLVQPTKALPTITEFLPTFVEEKSKKWKESAKRHNQDAIDLFVKIRGDRGLTDFTRKDIWLL